MIDILLILALLALLIVVMATPILLVIKFQAYKAKKYYKLLATDFGIEFTNEKSVFFGVEGNHKGCSIHVSNHSFNHSREISGVRFSKQHGVKISVHNQSLIHRNLSITSLNTVRNSSDFKQSNCEKYFHIKLAENNSLNDDLRQQLFEAASLLGIEDRFEIVQEESGAFVQVQSFPLVNKKRYQRCKATITFLINLNNYLLEKRSNEVGNIVNSVLIHQENRINELYKLMGKNYIGKNTRPCTAASISGGGNAFYLILKMKTKTNSILFGIEIWEHYKRNQYIYLIPHGIERSLANSFLKSILGDLIYFEGDEGNVDPVKFDQVIEKLKPIEESGALE